MMQSNELDTTYSITDRSLKLTDHQFDRSEYLLASEIKNWPQNSSVLICGSGTRGKLERDIKQLRPDLQITSMDPSLNFNQKRQRIVDLAGGEVLLYEPLSKPRTDLRGVFTGEQALKFHSKRLESHHADRLSHSDARNMDFDDRYFEIAIDVLGPMHYLRKNYDDILAYVTELARVLKTGGIVYLYDADQSILQIINKDGSFEVLSSSDYLEDDYFTLKLKKR